MVMIMPKIDKLDIDKLNIPEKMKKRLKDGQSDPKTQEMVRIAKEFAERMKRK